MIIDIDLLTLPAGLIESRFAPAFALISGVALASPVAADSTSHQTKHYEKPYNTGRASATRAKRT
jgi:hypothetical protein